jgi:hypothetical protein
MCNHVEESKTIQIHGYRGRTAIREQQAVVATSPRFPGHIVRLVGREQMTVA